MFTTKFDGILFIGDPHVCSQKIGRRKDDYLASVLLKLSHCAQLCKGQNLLPVITGDLFHKSSDNSLRMLNRLTRVLKSFPTVPLVLDGNHDMQRTALSEDDALELLALGGTVRTVDAAGEIGVVSIQGQPVRLWGCPYGAAIPSELPLFEGATIMLTHHDMAFTTSYPNSLPLVAVKNCAMVVNGHMHDTKPAMLEGATWWHNPGNIEPLSIDLAAHTPRAWRWSPELAEGTLDGLTLPHGTDLFDLVGLQVDAANADESVQALLDTVVHQVPAASQFSALIKAQAEADAQKTDDASVLADDLGSVLEATGVSDASRVLMQSLMNTLTGSHSMAGMQLPQG